MSTNISKVLARHGSQKECTREGSSAERPQGVRTPEYQIRCRSEILVMTLPSDLGDLGSHTTNVLHAGYRNQWVLVGLKECSIHRRRPWKMIPTTGPQEGGRNRQVRLSNLRAGEKEQRRPDCHPTRSCSCSSQSY
jgi:hypothetical protein